MRGKNLDGDGAIEAGIDRAIDLAHAAGADRRDDFVRAEFGAGGERHGGVEIYGGLRQALGL